MWMKTFADSAVREKLAGRGAEPVGNTPEQFAAHLREDMQRWAKVARATNMKIE